MARLLLAKFDWPQFRNLLGFSRIVTFCSASFERIACISPDNRKPRVTSRCRNRGRRCRGALRYRRAGEAADARSARRRSSATSSLCVAFKARRAIPPRRSRIRGGARASSARPRAGDRGACVPAPEGRRAAHRDLRRSSPRCAGRRAARASRGPLLFPHPKALRARTAFSSSPANGFAFAPSRRRRSWSLASAAGEPRGARIRLSIAVARAAQARGVGEMARRSRRDRDAFREMSRVVPGVSETMAMSRRASALTSELLPAFGAPMTVRNRPSLRHLAAGASIVEIARHLRVQRKHGACNRASRSGQFLSEKSIRASAQASASIARARSSRRSRSAPSNCFSAWRRLRGRLRVDEVGERLGAGEIELAVLHAPAA